jgi:hypothetical protein
VRRGEAEGVGRFGTVVAPRRAGFEGAVAGRIGGAVRRGRAGAVGAAAGAAARARARAARDAFDPAIDEAEEAEPVDAGTRLFLTTVAGALTPPP